MEEVLRKDLAKRLQKSNLLITVKDEGPGFAETSPQKIFKRFYSNRPSKFGEHSGLGLNIAKNIAPKKITTKIADWCLLNCQMYD